MKHRIFAAVVIAGTAFSSPASAQAFECTGSVASMAVAAVDAVVSWLGGGRASQIAQALQIKEAVIANFCAASMNDNLIEMKDYERRNIAHGAATGIPGINGMIRRTDPWMNRGGFLTSEAAIQTQTAAAYPEKFRPMQAADLIAVNDQFQQHERASYLSAVALQNMAAREQGLALVRARDHATAGRAGEGMRSELQAMNAIGGEQIVAINSLTAATVASQRAQAEKDMRDRATTVAANATVDDYMSTLTACRGCTLSSPFLGN